MIKSALNYPVSSIVTADSNIRYIIPRYQREYSWSKSEWEYLFDDLWENEPGHFLGSIICINQSEDTLNPYLELVDGQQRLSTLSLLFLAIHQCLGDYESQLDEEQKLDRLNLKRRLVIKTDKVKARLQLSNQNQNDLDYRSLLSSAGLLPEFLKLPAYAGNRKVTRAYRYFLSRLMETDGQGNFLFGVKELFDLLYKINGAYLVKIEVGSYANAYRLFESLNNRGMPLSAIDLIKNKLLAQVEARNAEELDSTFDKWQLILSNLEQDYKTQERFLRHFYNAYKDDSELVHIKITKATRTNIIEIYTSLIEKDPFWILQRLLETSKNYNRLIVPANEDNSPPLAKALMRLSRIGGAPSYQLLLYLLERFSLKEEELIDLVSFLVRFFIRRSATDLPPTRDLDTIFMKLVEDIRKTPENPLGIIFQKLKTVSAADELFEEKLRGDIYLENSWLARNILCTIEEEYQTRETMTDLWAWDKNNYIWTIEHIFPKGENIPADWVEMIAAGDRDKASALQQKYVHKLGNLTISGFNSALGTMAFLKKRDRADKKGLAWGYKNGLFLNKDLQDRDAWTIDDIELRTDRLVFLAKDFFTLEPEMSAL